MKQKLSMVLAVVMLAFSAFAQKANKSSMMSEGTKGRLFGIHFNMADYNAPTGIADPITGRVYQNFREMSKGLSLSYWKGLTSKLDFSLKTNLMFHDFAGLYRSVANKTEFGAELEPSLNLRPYTDKALIAPFLTLGIGGGYYTQKLGAYVPAGVGVQLNLNSTTYIMLQGQYRWTLTKNIMPNNLQYSLGFAQNIGKERAVKEVAVAPAVPVVVQAPVVETPKDSDGDGIIDANDKCPNVAGLAKYEGCPIPDTDGDGINDEQDKCPTVAGVAKYQGCPIPDTDGDGVNDEVDKCINEKGPASNFGCPVISQDVLTKINTAAAHIYFETGSSKLLPKSFSSLNDVAGILKQNPSYNVTIDGHTDNTGKAEKNQALSEARAAAVKAYLVSKGVAESKLSATGYGQDKPIADNNTAAGKAKNRRVELNVKNY